MGLLSSMQKTKEKYPERQQKLVVNEKKNLGS
jgi:hypothetical protein